MTLGYIPGIRVTLGYILYVNTKLSDLRQGSCSYTTRIRRCWRLHSLKEAEDKHSSKSHSICSCGHCWRCGGSDPDLNEQTTLVWWHSYPFKQNPTIIWSCCQREGHIRYSLQVHSNIFYLDWPYIVVSISPLRMKITFLVSYNIHI